MQKTSALVFRRLSACLFFLIAQIAGAQASPSAPTYSIDPSNPASVCGGAQQSCAAWKTFRTNYPFPYQTFALTREGNEAVIIISEPPPNFSRDELAKVLRAVFADDLIDLAYFRIPTGIDGWLEDAVARVRVRSDDTVAVYSGVSMSLESAPAGIIDRLRFMHILFYDTADGFWVDNVDAPRPQLNVEELKVSAANLDDWLRNKDQTWSSLSPERTKSTWAAIRSAPAPGVYERDAGGLIAFTIPKSAHLNTLRADFRRFSVASDLLIGGVRQANGGLVLLARKRATRLAVLPPLRFETLVAFASNRTTEVVQSYERRRIFAGKIQHGELAGWDWAPILLSQHLEDTEFGTLLNLADQILKSWSEHGRISYYSFSYPSPDSFPFGDKAASEVFFDEFNTRSLVFNWNTKHFATLTESGAQQTVTADRTGALPILYIPGDSLFERVSTEDAGEQAELARNYFGARGDPILTRVAQNVLLYQSVQSLFKMQEVQAPNRKSRSDRVAEALREEAIRWVGKLTNPREADQFDAEVRRMTLQFLKQSGMSTTQLGEILSSPQSIEGRFNERIAKLKALRSRSEALSDEARVLNERAEFLFRSTCTRKGGNLSVEGGKLVCTWEGVDEGFEETHRLESQAKNAAETASALVLQANKEVEAINKWATDLTRGFEIGSLLAKTSGEAELDDILQRVLSIAATPESISSIRTPSVVLSKNTDNSDAIGGHNIDLVPSRVKVSAAAKHPSWASGTDVPTLVLPPNRLRDASALQRDMGAPLSTIQSSAQSIDSVLKGNAKGSLLEEMRQVSASYSSSSARLEAIKVRVSRCDCDALISQEADGSIVLARPGPPPASSQVFGKSGILEALAGPPPSQVVRFEGMSRGTVENLVRTAQLMAEPRAAQSRGLGGFLETVANAFRRSDSAEAEIISFTRPGKSAEVLEISAEQGVVPEFRQRLSWRTAKAEAGADDIWINELGAEPEDLEGSEGVIVRFKSIGSEPLGIRVKTATAQQQTLKERLLSTVNTWLGRQSAKPTHFEEGLVSLRAEIKERLPETVDLRFFYRRNAKKIRAAKLRQRAEIIVG